MHFKLMSQKLAMSDDKNKRGPADRARINITESYEVQYWSEKFGISPETLRNAVNKVGVMSADVEAYLKKNSRA
jgi:hypothetical protein